MFKKIILAISAITISFLSFSKEIKKTEYNIFNSFSDYALNNTDDPVVKFYIGTEYFNNEKFEKAFDWFLSAAEDGMPQAIQNVAVMVEKGIGVRSDWKRALNAYKTAALEGNNVYAQMYLAELFRKGKKIDKSYEQAYKYYRLAADNNEPTAAYYVAKMNMYGIGTDRNIKEARKYLKRNVRSKHTKSIYEMGNIYRLGIQTKMNKDLAAKYYKNAADLGNHKAMLALGKMLFRGEGVAIDYKDGIELLKKSSYLGNKDAKLLLGTFYETGYGVPKDKNIARDYFLDAARFGNTDAMIKLANIAEKKNDTIEYMRYYEMAAELGNKEAQKSLAYIYHNGSYGIDIDNKKYSYWINKYNKKDIKNLARDFFDDNPPEISYKEALRNINNSVSKNLDKNNNMNIKENKVNEEIKNKEEIIEIRGVKK